MKKVTDEEKRQWFLTQIEQRQQSNPLQSEGEVVEFVRLLRRTFREIYGRDVPGSFIRILLNDLGVAREQSESIKRKREYMFGLMDANKAYRESKTQLRKAVMQKYDEKILNIVFDEIWDEYHLDQLRRREELNIDMYGQPGLFNE